MNEEKQPLKKNKRKLWVELLILILIIIIILFYINSCNTTEKNQNKQANNSSQIKQTQDTQTKDEETTQDTFIVAPGIIQIRATAFNNKENIPDKYTCDGEDINPALKIEQIPTNTKSLVLIVEDPDAQGGNWTHWLVYNIEPNKIIGENTAPGTQGLNSWGINRYRGPCPPTKTKHRYYFNIYALDTTLNLAPGSRKQEVIDAMQNHIIDEGALLGYYER